VIHRAAVLAALAATSCVSSTGGQTVSFAVAAAGPADATGGPRELTNGLGWHIVLTRARLHIGAIYLNLSVPTAGAQFTSCILPGIYTAEELTGLDVDVLSPTPQPFPAPGTGTDDAATTAEIWLTGGDVNAKSDLTLIADVAGTADKNGVSVPFSAHVTIGQNRLVPPSDSSQPSQHPICKQRIVTPIRVDIRPQEGGTLLVRVDPDFWFKNVDFALLDQVSTSPPAYEFPDDLSTTPGQNLFNGLRAASFVYTFTFQPPTP
jgi:hypothetical protein